MRFERNLLFQNLPGNRHKIILSTFRFIENLLQELLCLQWSNTSIHKKRKQIIRKENYLGNHFSLLVTYYIIFIFNFLKSFIIIYIFIIFKIYIFVKLFVDFILDFWFEKGQRLALCSLSICKTIPFVNPICGGVENIR